MNYYIHLRMKMEQIVSSETSAIKSQTPGNYPKRNKLQLQHGESLRTRVEVPWESLYVGNLYTCRTTSHLFHDCFKSDAASSCHHSSELGYTITLLSLQVSNYLLES